MFITFEGIEGCGKSTQLVRLAASLEYRGVPVLRTFEPGGTRIGEEFRRILLANRNKDLCPLAELLLYEADRSQHVSSVIRPALERGEWVVCDRFCDATTAYQGAARGQDPELIRILNAAATGGLVPDLTFLLDCPVEEGLARAMRREAAGAQVGQDRFERESLAFHQSVREGYLRIAREEPDRFEVIDASQDMETVEAEILRRLEARSNMSGRGERHG
ncbi:MAG: dTMP kinase [Desulfobacteraceae bacterium]